MKMRRRMPPLLLLLLLPRIVTSVALLRLAPLLLLARPGSGGEL
jgi:hypothetical protein